MLEDGGRSCCGASLAERDFILISMQSRDLTCISSFAVTPLAFITQTAKVHSFFASSPPPLTTAFPRSYSAIQKTKIMSYQGPTDELNGSERRPSPQPDQAYMMQNPNIGQPMQAHPQTVPFGSIPQNSLPQPTGDPAMFAWGTAPYGMQQGHPQYAQYSSHGAPPHVQQQFMAPPGPHYAAAPGMQNQPNYGQQQPSYGQQQPFPVQQGQMYSYPYQHPGQQMHHPMHQGQPQQAGVGVSHPAQSPNPGFASPLVPTPRNAVTQIGYNPKQATVSAPNNGPVEQQNPQAQKNAPTDFSPETTSPYATNGQTNLQANDEPVAKDEIFRYAMQLVGPKPKRQELPPELHKKKPTQQVSRRGHHGHPFFASKVKSPDLLSYKITPLSSHTIGGLHDQIFAQHTPSCHCRRPISRGMGASSENAHVCLKLYCQCFAFGAMCSDRCGCSSACFNNAEHSVERARAVGAVLNEDPNGFRRDMDWMTDLQRTCRNDYVLPKEKKAIVPLKAMDHEDVTDDSLRIAKVSNLADSEKMLTDLLSYRRIDTPLT